MGLLSSLKKVKDKAGDVGSSIADAASASKGKVVGGLAVGGAALGAGIGAGYTAGAGGVRAIGRSIMALHGNGGWIFFILVTFAHVAHLMDIWKRGPIFTPADPIFAFYIVLALLATFMFYKDPGDPLPLTQLPKFLAITTFAYYAPALLSWLSQSGYLMRDLATALMLIAPVWWLYIFFNPSDGFTRLLALIFIIGWFGYIFANLALPVITDSATVTQAIVSPYEVKVMAVEAWQKFTGTYVDAGVKSVYNIKDFSKNRIANATQVYYTGTVDQSQGEPIGVFINDLKPLYMKFDVEAGDDVIVDATMKARTVGDKISITNTCYLNYTDATTLASAGSRKIVGKVYPPDVSIDRTGEWQEKYPLQCSIANADLKQLPAGKVTTGYTTFSSTFNFETWAYAEYGFMDSDLKIAFKDSMQNPAQVMGVPMTIMPKYTPGPVMIGMPADTQPLSYNSPTASDRTPKNYLPAFGATLSSAWAGKGTIKEFKAIRFYVPRPFGLKLDECNPKSDGQTLVGLIEDKWSENEVYKVYGITDPSKIRIGTSSLEYPYITIRCPMTVDYTDTLHPVLGPAGAGKFTFFVNTTYVYELEAKTPVTIGGPAASTSTNNNAAGSTQPQCVGDTNCYQGTCTCKSADGQRCSYKEAAGYATRTCHDYTDQKDCTPDANKCSNGICYCTTKIDNTVWYCSWAGTAANYDQNYGARTCKVA